MGEDRLTFEISGNDYKNLKRFQKQHKDCLMGAVGDQFSYHFVPTSLGMSTTVTCSCGQELCLGDFMGPGSGEYDEADHPVLTGQVFEKAVHAILIMKDPRYRRMSFGKDRESDFETVYNISAGGIAPFSDDRIRSCILYKQNRDKYGRTVDNYEGMSDEEKLKAFFRYFAGHAGAELRRYGSKNEQLMEMIQAILGEHGG